MPNQPVRRSEGQVGVYGKPRNGEQEGDDLDTLHTQILRPLKRYIEATSKALDVPQRSVVERFIRNAQILGDGLDPLAEELEAFGVEHDLFPLEERFAEIVVVAVRQFFQQHPRTRRK